jgi:hypothetical protein
VHAECPKCRSPNAWYARDGTDIWLRCLCGLLKLVETKLENITIRHTDSVDVSLPRLKTKLWYCLNMLAGLEPVTTQELTRRLNIPRQTCQRVKCIKEIELLTVSDVASQLTVLRYKGLADTIEDRKGLLGGSTWVLTLGAKRLLGKKE